MKTPMDAVAVLFIAIAVLCLVGFLLIALVSAVL